MSYQHQLIDHVTLPTAQDCRKWGGRGGIFSCASYRNTFDRCTSYIILSMAAPLLASFRWLCCVYDVFSCSAAILGQEFTWSIVVENGITTDSW